MRPRHAVMAAAALALLAAGAMTLALAGPRPAAEPPRYVLTQALCIGLDTAGQPSPRESCQMQVVPAGAIVEVQVPGTPSHWSLASVPAVLVGTDAPALLPSPGRVPGTSDVWVFTFRARTAGTGSLELREVPRLLTPAGTFRFPITVQ